MSVTVDAAPTQLAVVRGAVEVWLTTLCEDVTEPDPVVAAVNEAVSNATEHAYRSEESGPVTIDLAVERAAGGRRVRVDVTDHGTWRPAEADSGRGNGIPLMRALMADVRLDRGPGGTAVHMLSRVAPSAE